MEKTISQSNTLYPDSAYALSAYALSALAKAYAKFDDVSQAVLYQIKAVEKSKSMIEWHQDKHKKILKEFQDKLKIKSN